VWYVLLFAYSICQLSRTESYRGLCRISRTDEQTKHNNVGETNKPSARGDDSLALGQDGCPRDSGAEVYSMDEDDEDDLSLLHDNVAIYRRRRR